MRDTLPDSGCDSLESFASRAVWNGTPIESEGTATTGYVRGLFQRVNALLRRGEALFRWSDGFFRGSDGLFRWSNDLCRASNVRDRWYRDLPNVDSSLFRTTTCRIQLINGLRDR